MVFATTTTTTTTTTTISALAVFSRNALYKSTFYFFYLLTYLLSVPSGD